MTLTLWYKLDAILNEQCPNDSPPGIDPKEVERDEQFYKVLEVLNDILDNVHIPERFLSVAEAPDQILKEGLRESGQDPSDNSGQNRE